MDRDRELYLRSALLHYLHEAAGAARNLGQSGLEAFLLGATDSARKSLVELEAKTDEEES